MKVTKIKYSRMESVGSSKILAICSVVFDDCLMVHGIAIRLGAGGEYVTMPHKVHSQSNSADKKEVVHPLNKDFHLYLKNVILDGYFTGGNRSEYGYRPEE